MYESMFGRRYRRVRLLGRGPTGEVWLAEDLLLHRRVAVRIISAGHPLGQSGLDRMAGEARLAAQLRHPNAVAVYDLVIEHGQPNVVSEYVPGTTLAAEITASGSGLAPGRVAVVGAAIADALAAAHRLGLVHGDVTPANILITEAGEPKLADFGVARSLGPGEPAATGAIVGAPEYVAPEVVRGGRPDAGSDIWSLGVTLYAALDGHPPFGAVSDGVLALVGRPPDESPTPPRGDATVAAAAVGDAIMRLLQLDPAARPTAPAAAALLRNPPPPLARPRPGPVVAAAPPDGSRPGRRRRAGVIVGSLAAAVVAVGVAIVTIRGGSGSSGPATTPASAVARPSPAASTTLGAPSSAARASTSAPASGPAVAAAVYSAPGGVSVRAPAGWRLDRSTGTPSVRDYLAPGSGSLDTGTYFRIGVGNPHPRPTIAQEVAYTVAYLRGPTNPYRHVEIRRRSTSTFLGVPSADIEFVGDDSTGAPRHVLERLWIAGGVTRIVQLNVAAADWTAQRPLFAQLVASCRVR